MNILRCNTKDLRNVVNTGRLVEYNIKNLEEYLNNGSHSYYIAYYNNYNLVVRTSNGWLKIDDETVDGSGSLANICNLLFILRAGRADAKYVDKIINIIGNYMVNGGSIKSVIGEVAEIYNSIKEEFDLCNLLDISDSLKSAALYNYNKYITMN